MKNIILIAYEFYPTNTGGSHRPFRIASFLKNNGYNPIVITADDDALKSKEDPSLQLLLNNIKITTFKTTLRKENWWTKLTEKYYFNTVDDTYTRWKLTLIEKIQEITEKHSVEAIFITAPPFSMATATQDLKNKFNIPIWLDLRDAWSQWNIYPYASKLHYRLTLNTEKKALIAANKIFVTSKVTLNDFLILHPEISKNNFLYLPNSFDQFENTSIQTSQNDQKIIKIGYVGSFYFNPATELLQTKKWYNKKPHQWLQYTPTREYWQYRSPYYFFKILQKAFELSPSLINKVEINFVGDTPSWLLEMIDAFNLSKSINHVGRLPKSDVVKFQNEQDLLLITSAKRELKPDYSIAGKTFEYFSLLKPILAVVSNGAQKDILQESGLALILDPDECENAAKKLISFLENGTMISPKKHIIENYKTSNTLKKLLELL